ncbi:MAG TPA: gluconate 2-dehydrogenase subunit 3 family protein [Gemmatimonadales bacterium]|jgi:gluconate 2-dehydrogenase gamma chain|nr:gluconate 2-dehydrogenase subunit 3 family protein [Gemmatimonadales bacterium]
MSDQVTRRAFLAAAGAAGAAWLLADPKQVQAALVHARNAVATPPPYRFDVLTPAQAADLEAICMRIFPSDGTPGAKEAGVIHFIDKSLATFAAPQKDFVLLALVDLNKKVAEKWPGTPSFVALTAAQQDEYLKSIEKTPFFGQLRFATCVGMFGNPSYGGNQGEVGWKLLGFQSHGIYQPPFGYYDAEAQKGH